MRTNVEKEADGEDEQANAETEKNEFDHVEKSCRPENFVPEHVRVRPIDCCVLKRGSTVESNAFVNSLRSPTSSEKRPRECFATS